MGEVSPAFLRLTAVSICWAGSASSADPHPRQARLTAVAALGCALFQLCAIVFHVARGEAANTPFNFVLVALSIFVLWGRRRGL